MTSRTIASAQTVAFWRYMTKRYGTRVRDKEAAGEMQVLAAVLASMGIMDAEKFLSRYTTTLGTRIYPCFAIGDPSVVPLASQVGVCVHEHVHVRQFQSVSFPLDYCFNSAKRALLEAEAYRATMEIEYWFTGRCSPARYAAQLKAYACTDDDIACAREYLGKSAAIVRKGGIVTPEAQVAIRWLDRYVSALPILQIASRA